MLTFTNSEVQDLFNKVKEVGRQARYAVEMSLNNENHATRRALLEINFQQADLRFEMAFNQAKMARAERELARRERPMGGRRNYNRVPPFR